MTETANTEANTIANTEPKVPDNKNAMDIYSKYLDHITSRINAWKTTSLPPSQKDIAISIGKISKEKE